jgi:D-3-phosphoglycerate dehydrogenase
VRIVVLDDYQDAVRGLEAFALLAGHDVTVLTEPLDDPARIAGAEALVLIRQRSRVTAELLDALPALRVLAQTGPLGTHVDLEAVRARGIAVVEGSGSPGATAELTWALVLAASRRLPQYAAALREGRWQRNGLEGGADVLGVALRGRTLGVWGHGRIGSLVAGYGAAFGMRVLVWGREASVASARAAGHEVAASREELLEQADVLSLHLRLNDETRGLVTADDLARMRPEALFVNTARAELVEPGALLVALERGRPGGAALDVFEQEPLPPDDPLLRLPNVVATPHLGYVERGAYEQLFRDAFRGVLAHAGSVQPAP